MSADLLRRAARVARETADAAPDGPWQTTDLPGPEGSRCLVAADGDPVAYVRDWPGGIGDATGNAAQTGQHIALWHPGVARAVAEWLEGAADVMEIEKLSHAPEDAVTIARLLMGEEGTTDE